MEKGCGFEPRHGNTTENEKDDKMNTTELTELIKKQLPQAVGEELQAELAELARLREENEKWSRENVRLQRHASSLESKEAAWILHQDQTEKLADGLRGLELAKAAHAGYQDGIDRQLENIMALGKIAFGNPRLKFSGDVTGYHGPTGSTISGGIEGEETTEA